LSYVCISFSIIKHLLTLRSSVHFPKPFQKDLNTSLGYRNFVLSDALSKLPITEKTKTANVVDSQNLRREKTLKFRKEHPFCPRMHPQFVKGTGCFAYTQVVSEDIRKQIAYGAPKFKKVYNFRNRCERIFSRLLDLYMQNTGVRGLRTVSNHCTITHITVLLIALTISKTGNKDKIHF